MPPGPRQASPRGATTLLQCTESRWLSGWLVGWLGGPDPLPTPSSYSPPPPPPLPQPRQPAADVTTALNWLPKTHTSSLSLLTCHTSHLQQRPKPSTVTCCLNTGLVQFEDWTRQGERWGGVGMSEERGLRSSPPLTRHRDYLTSLPLSSSPYTTPPQWPSSSSSLTHLHLHFVLLNSLCELTVPQHHPRHRKMPLSSS